MIRLPWLGSSPRVEFNSGPISASFLCDTAVCMSTAIQELRQITRIKSSTRSSGQCAFAPSSRSGCDRHQPCCIWGTERAASDRQALGRILHRAASTACCRRSIAHRPALASLGDRSMLYRGTSTGCATRSMRNRGTFTVLGGCSILHRGGSTAWRRRSFPHRDTSPAREARSMRHRCVFPEEKAAPTQKILRMY